MNVEAGAADVTIDSLRRDEVDEAARLLARCFATEPLHAHLLRGLPRDRRVRVLTPFFSTSLRVFLPGGGIRAARIEGRLVGITICTPPGIYPPHGLRGIVVRARLLMAFVRVVLRAPTYGAVRKTSSASDGVTPTEPHWYFQWGSVDPDFEGRGIYGRLADDVLRRSDEQGSACYFSTFTPAMRSLCERRGFSVLREVRPLPGGPPCWLMWREPRGAPTA